MTEPNDFRDKMIKQVNPDGSVVYLPDGSFSAESLTKDTKARLAIGLVAGGTLACAAINCAVNSLNWITNCGHERILAAMYGVQIGSEACVQVIPTYLSLLFK